ncbi:MAG: TetR/AcrR family transcriptional regulator C-terminal domain-containing protein [Oscillospiraceae bacterium]|nr:TetR/AcrR family transcriptional regulator C-terminal domain-containing protein [Oscillospiraceae bacterium]
MSEAQSTKKALAQAMKELMAEKAMSKISVGEIADSCGMSRKSFYYHFKDKYDLVNWIYYTEFVSTIQFKSNMDPWTIIQLICDYFYANRVFYTNAFQIEGQNSFRDYFADVMTPVMEVVFQDLVRPQPHRDFFISFMVDAVRLAIIRWLKEGSTIPPQEFVRLMRQAVEGVALHVVDRMQMEQRHRQARQKNLFHHNEKAADPDPGDK